MPNKPYIINARGQKEPFSYQKVFRSAKRVGANRELADKIARNIEHNVKAGDKTFDIFKQVKSQLNNKSPLSAIRFNLKQAIRKLGPTGFPFEKYMASIFTDLGFQTTLKSNCIRRLR